MSEERGITMMVLVTGLFGVIILMLGILLTYFSLRAEVGLVSPRIFAPVGVAVALVGGFMLLARGS